ncbi:MAG: PAS domain S-box protein [Syntrophaceae bacterium]|nr:PAS domain S-box protein [Syntrophaceae bacterium]
MRRVTARKTESRGKNRGTLSTGKPANRCASTDTRRRAACDPGALLDALGGMLYILCPGHRIESMSDAARRAMGRDGTGELCHDFLFGLDAPCPGCRADLVRQGGTQRRETRSRRDDRWYACILAPPPRGEEPAALPALVVDVTEQKLAEEALRLGEERYRAIFENSLVGIYQSTPGGRFLRVNPACARIFGFASPDEMVETVTDIAGQVFVDAEDRRRCLDILQQRGTLERFEVRMRRRDGRVIWTALNARVVRDGGGRTLFIEGVVEDITERKRVEEALRLSEERFSKAFHASPAPLAIATIDEGRYIDVNERFLEMLGCARDEIIGRSSVEMGFWADSAVRQDLVARLRREGRVRDAPVARRTKDGRLRQTLWSAEIVRLGGKDVLLSLHQDVTELREAEERLRAGEEKYRLLAENVSDIIWTADTNLRFTYVSPSAERILGWSADDWPSLTLQDYIAPAHREPIRALLAEEIGRPFAPGVDDARVVRVELEALRKDGSACWVEVSARLLRDTAGNPVSLIGVARDITDRKQIEEALRASENKYRQLFETCPIGIAVCGLDGRLLEANRAFQAITGYGLEELRARRFDEITPPEYREFERQIPGHLEREPAVTYEKEYTKKEGGRVPVSVTAWVSRDDAGVKRHLGAFVLDLSDRARQEQARRQLERQLHQAQKMEAIGTLAGGIAHDFNNILFAVIGFAELSLQDAGDDQTRWNLRQILNACNRAKTLVDQILAFSRPVEQAQQALDVVPLTKEVVKFLRSSLPATIDISVESAVSHSVILADPARIHQVIMNLCTNAAHAMRAAGGRLCIRVDNAAPPAGALPGGTRCGATGAFVRLSVSDTGHGIDPSILDRIFDPFFTTKPPGEGTGLGLSVVHGIVKNLGGAVLVHSEPGRGSTFDVFIPALGTAGPRPEPPAGPLPRGTERVLLVDDEAPLAEALSRMLTALGYRVTAVQDGPAALRLFREDPGGFDLVITDMTMPRMTGAELACEILRCRPGTPVILCTGYSDCIGEAEALAMGIRRFLLKPLFLGQLALEVRAVLDGQTRNETP